MKPTWLYGPPVRTEARRDSATLTVSGVHVLNLDEFKQLIAEGRRLLGVDLEVRRLVGGPDPGQWHAGDDTIELDDATDTDLTRAGLKGYNQPTPGLWVDLEIALGALAWPKLALSLIGNLSVVLDPRAPSATPDPSGEAHDAAATTETAPTIPDVPAFATRVAEILNGSQRRIPTWKWLQAAKVAVPIVSLAVWLGFAFSVWPNAWAVALGGLAVAAFWPTAVQTIQRYENRRSMGPNSGRVLVDATPQKEVRAARANTRRDFKVGAATAVITGVVSVVATLLVTGGK